MRKLLSILLLLCSISAFGQLETTIEQPCNLLSDYNYDTQKYATKKVKKGIRITVFEENIMTPNFYNIRYNDKLYIVDKQFINQSDLKAYNDSLLKAKEKAEHQKRYNDSVQKAQQKKLNDSIALEKYIKETEISAKQEARALEVYDEIENIAKERVKQGMPIEISYLDSGKPNSAGGTSLIFILKNISTKRIKYISVTGYPTNAVNDKCTCTVRGYSQCTRRGIGPIEPNKYANYSWENTWYNHTIDKFIPTSINIQYMDGSTLTINGSKVKSIMQNRLLDDILKEKLNKRDADLDKIKDKPLLFQ